MATIVNRKLTGRFYFRRRFFGGLDLMVEEFGQYEDPITIQLSPGFRHYRKADESDIMLLSLRSALGIEPGTAYRRKPGPKGAPNP